MKYAIVDVGSNTMRLSIYECSENKIKLLMNKKEMVGLAGYIQNGMMSDEGTAAAIRTLKEFGALVDNLGVGALRVFGTAPLRNIGNTEEVLETLHAATGITIDVLTGVEEAELSFQGAALGGGKDSGILADIGGGSTELVVYQDGAVCSGASLPVGSLSLFTQFVSGLFPTKEERKAIQACVKKALSRAAVATVRQVHLVGVGGTIRAAAKLCNDLAGDDPENRDIPAGEIFDLYRTLKKGDRAALRQILRSAPDRVHTILPGLIVLKTVLKAFDVTSVSVSRYGVREGYLIKRVLKESDPHGRDEA